MPGFPLRASENRNHTGMSNNSPQSYRLIRSASGYRSSANAHTDRLSEFV